MMKVFPGPNPPSNAPTKADASAQLRILATSDVHANLLPYDYYLDRDDMPFGLARLATLIADARAEVRNSILLDNGDMLQGTPISDIIAQPDGPWQGIHPVILAMNHLGYDAAGLGNHEFNFGLEWLRNTAKNARFPYLCANIERASGSDHETFWSPSLILERAVQDDRGTRHTLRIGVLSVMPPQVTTWDKSHLDGRVQSADMLDVARREVPRLRAKGAEIVILLAHTGIEGSGERPMMENAAIPLAHIDGVDAMITGHIHSVFPSQRFHDTQGVDPARGMIGNIPVVMPGYRGSHLGVIDLDLQHADGRWSMASSQAAVRPVDSPNQDTVKSDVALREELEPAHKITLQSTNQSIGATTGPLHSYLSLVGVNPAERLVAQAQRAALTTALHAGPYGDLPVLASVAPFRAGGRGGPRHYTDIAAGPLALRHVADLYAFPNTLVGLLMTGRDLRDWLDRAAIIFNGIDPGTTDAPLCDRAMPSHIFEIVEGLTYEIDLSQPPRVDIAGSILNPEARRIHNLRHAGRAVKDDDRFVMATNSYRAAGSGPFPAAKPAQVIHEGPRLVRDHLLTYLRQAGPLTPRDKPIWRFCPLPGTSVIHRTGPGLRDVAPSPLRQGMTPLDLDADGFLRLRIAL